MKSSFNISFLLAFCTVSLAVIQVSGQSTTTFSFTGAAQTYTVPPCVTQIEVVVAGAKGGGPLGGNGATVTAVIDVTPGQVLQVNVGGQGGCPNAGWNGGGNSFLGQGPSCGGGGASDIRLTPYGLANRIVVAAGGGGQGGGNPTNVAGGVGGCANGSPGTAAFGSGGGGATQFNGGGGGTPYAFPGTNGGMGSLGQGGNGGQDNCASNSHGAGGGGGYYGGGGGGPDCIGSTTFVGGSGGGGGSSLTPVGGACTQGNNTGNGYITITPNNEGIQLEVNPSAPAVCNGESVEITVSGAVNYLWSPDTGLNTTTGETVTASPEETTTYLITADDGGDCSDTISVTVLVIPQPVISVSPSSPTICPNESIDLTASGATAFAWSPAGGLNNTVGAVVTANPASTQTYTVTGATGSCSGDTTVTVTVNESPEITIMPDNPSFCPGESVEITASGAVTYSWSPASGLNTTDEATVTASPNATTTYTVTGTDADGCSNTIEVTATILPLPDVEAGDDLLICPGIGIELDGISQDAILYSWTPTESLDNPTISNPVASPTANTTYTLEVTDVNGCTNTDEVFIEMLEESYETTINAEICEGESYTLPDGMVTTNSGTYEDLFNSVLGCDSLVITILDVNEVYELTQVVSLCAGENYTLPNGNNVTTSGNFEVPLQTVSGCDSIVTFEITFNPNYNITTDAFICESQSYTMPNGTVQSTEGTYVFDLTTSAGCDSTITVNLEVQETIVVNLDAEICANESYILPDGSTVNTQGTYDVVIGSSGCDSLYQVELTVFPTHSVTDQASVCAGEQYTLPDGSVVSISGTYAINYTSVNGCDSVLNFELTILPTYTTNQNIGICTGETFTLPDGTAVSEAGVYPQLYTAANGCDSTVNYNLTLYPLYDLEINLVVCDNENVSDPFGNQITGDAEYYLELTSMHGCDSLVHLTIQFFESYSASQEVSFCDGQLFGTSGGQVISTPGIYQDVFQTSNGCDSVLIYNVTVLPRPKARYTASPRVASIYDGPVQFYNESQGADSIEWNFGSFGITVVDDPIIDFDGQAGFYPVCITAWNEYGCVHQFCADFEVREEFTVFIPNAFSPNEDGINDLFYVQGKDIDPNQFHLQIFDRLGELVFESRDPEAKWNGDIKGGKHYGQNEVYVYRVMAGSQATTKTYEFTGTVTLVR